MECGRERGRFGSDAGLSPLIEGKRYRQKDRIKDQGTWA